MMQIKFQPKSSDTPKIYCYDTAKYQKKISCDICKCKIYYNSKNEHLNSENHKLAVQLTSLSKKPIEDIKKTILEYKMVQKFMKKRFSPDDNSSSTVENTDLISSEDNEQQSKKNIKPSITIDKIRYKTDVYARQLANKAERYEKTKAINILVNTIQNSTKRLTNLQKEKYYYLLNKYPENEYLLSIKHLVPEIVIEQPKEPKPIKQPKIKQVKKKQKVYPIIVYKDTSINTNDKLSYPIIEYKDSTFNINDKDNNNKISYPIIKYEHKL
jgi:hypothetical protein